LISICINLNAKDKILEKYLVHLATIKSMKVNFTQRNFWPSQDIEKKTSGFLYTKGSKIRLDYSKPTKQLMVGNEEELIFYFPARKQAIIQDANYWQSLLSPELLAKEYINYCKLDSTFPTVDGYTFKFTPTEKMSDFSEIVIQISKSDSLIKFFEYKDKYNNIVGFEFSEYIINPQFPIHFFLLIFRKM